MKNINRLGANIRSLRKAYRETQEQLGEIIHVEKNAVSYYENDKREPNKETLRAIAKHYMVSVEELLYEDFSDIDRITIDKNVVENISTLFSQLFHLKKRLRIQVSK